MRRVWDSIHLLERGVPADEITATTRAVDRLKGLADKGEAARAAGVGLLAYTRGDLARLIGRPTTPLAAAVAEEDMFHHG